MMNINKSGTAREDARLRKLMEDPRYWKHQEPAYVNMIKQGFKDLYDQPAPEALAAEGQAANKMGINGTHHAQDSMIAHVTPGEVVIPLSAQTPQLMQYLYQTLGKDMLKYTVGSGQEQRNPTSGLAAFAGEDDDNNYDWYINKIKKEIILKEAEIQRLRNKLYSEPDPNQQTAIDVLLFQAEQDLEALKADLEHFESL